MYNRGMVEILSCSGHVISCWILIGAASMTWQQTYVISYHWLVLSALICLLKQFAHQRYYKNEPCFIEGFLGGKSTFKETFILMHRNEPRIQNLNPIWAYNLIWRRIFPSPYYYIIIYLRALPQTRRHAVKLRPSQHRLGEVSQKSLIYGFSCVY